MVSETAAERRFLSSPKAYLVSERCRKAQRRAAKVFTWMASCRAALETRMHSAKCSNIWTRWRMETKGKTRPKRLIEASITCEGRAGGPWPWCWWLVVWPEVIESLTVARVELCLRELIEEASGWPSRMSLREKSTVEASEVCREEKAGLTIGGKKGQHYFKSQCSGIIPEQNKLAYIVNSGVHYQGKFKGTFYLSVCFFSRGFLNVSETLPD